MNRFYRSWVNPADLFCFNVRLKESDLCIHACQDLSLEAQKYLAILRQDLDDYIHCHPFFASSFKPLIISPNAPEIVKLMASSSQMAGVGPMASVAGAIAELLGEKLSALSTQVIIENGGDIFLRTSIERVVAIYAGNSALSGKVGLRMKPDTKAIGICTSSATIGPSISLGKTDASVVVAPSAALADAAASAIGNAVMFDSDVERGLEVARRIQNITGAVIIVGDTMGIWGDLELCQTDIANNHMDCKGKDY